MFENIILFVLNNSSISDQMYYGTDIDTINTNGIISRIDSHARIAVSQGTCFRI